MKTKLSIAFLTLAMAFVFGCSKTDDVKPVADNSSSTTAARKTFTKAIETPN